MMFIDFDFNSLFINAADDYIIDETNAKFD